MAQAPIQFDRASGALEGAKLWERTAAVALSPGIENIVEFFASGLQLCANLLRKTLPERNIAGQAQPGCDICISLWRRLLEQIAQPFVRL